MLIFYNNLLVVPKLVELSICSNVFQSIRSVINRQPIPTICCLLKLMPSASAIDNSDKHRHRSVISAAEMNDVDYVQFYSVFTYRQPCCVVLLK